MAGTINRLLCRYQELLRYCFWGAMTVLVNTAMYCSLAITPVGDIAANTVAFFIAVQFAYVVNTKWVFQQPFTRKNFFQFWGMRIGTVLIDNGGMWLLLTWRWNNLLAKCAVNVVVIILNYIFSKLVIYRKRGRTN